MATDHHVGLECACLASKHNGWPYHTIYANHTHLPCEWVPAHVCATYLRHCNRSVVVEKSRINGTTNHYPNKTGTFLHVKVREHCPPCVFPKWTRSRDLWVAFVSCGPGPFGTKIACYQCVVHFGGQQPTYLPHITPCQKACHLWKSMYFYMYFIMLGCDIYGFDDTLWFSMVAVFPLY